MGDATARLIESGFTVKIVREEYRLAERLHGSGMSYATCYYIFGYILALVAAILVLVGATAFSWEFSDTGVEVQMTYATGFATSVDTSNNIVVQVATSVANSFGMSWYWTGFGVGWLAVVLFMPMLLAIYYGSWYNEEKEGGIFSRFANNFLYRQLFLRDFDPLVHAILIPIMIGLWVSIWWYVYTERTWPMILLFAFGVIFVRLTHLVAEYAARSSPFPLLKNPSKIPEEDTKVELHGVTVWLHSNQDVLMGLWLFALACIVTVSSIYLWKYPHGPRQAYIVISFFLLVCFEVVLWVMNLIHYESIRHPAVQAAVRAALHVFFFFFISFGIWWNGKKGKSMNDSKRQDLLASSVARSGTTMILVACLASVIFWLQLGIAPGYQFYPPLTFPSVTF